MRSVFQLLHIKNRQTINRTVVFVFLVSFIAVCLLSEAYTLSLANHEHDHNDVHSGCAACVQIQTLAKLLAQFAVYVSSALFAFIVLVPAIKFLYFISSLSGFYTLANLKIRINN